MNAPHDFDLLIEAARRWREFAATAQNANLAQTCIDAARTLEMEANGAIPRCACCFKPFSGGMRL